MPASTATRTSSAMGVSVGSRPRLALARGEDAERVQHEIPLLRGIRLGGHERQERGVDAAVEIELDAGLEIAEAAARHQVVHHLLADGGHRAPPIALAPGAPHRAERLGAAEPR